MVGIVGYMSGGKTLSACMLMLEYMRSGHVCCSNIRLKCQGVTSYLCSPCVLWKRNYFLIVEDNPIGYHVISQFDYEHFPMGSPRGSADYSDRLVYIFLDEISSLFDSITHSSVKEVQHVATWARHTEKRGQIIYLIMQFSTELHKRLRNHVTEYISCTNTSNLRIPLLGIRLPRILRGYIIQTRYLGDEETLIQRGRWIPIDSRVFACYDTSQIVHGHQIGVSYTPASLYSQDIINRKRRLYLCRLFVILLVLEFLLLVFGLWLFSLR